MAKTDIPLVISGGPIHTADQSGTTADAIAIERGRVVRTRQPQTIETVAA